MKILIIDDDEAIVEIWSLSLKKAGFEVISASSGKEGIQLAKSQMPDLILLDQIMPDLKGNDVLKTIKTDAQTKEIPVALVSNYSESQLAQQAIEEGAVDYIFKYQVEPEDLVTKVKAFIQEKNTVPTTTSTN
jgi:CheY-like chemotaxis protein